MGDSGLSALKCCSYNKAHLTRMCQDEQIKYGCRAALHSGQQHVVQAPLEFTRDRIYQESEELMIGQKDQTKIGIQSARNAETGLRSGDKSCKIEERP